MAKDWTNWKSGYRDSNNGNGGLDSYYQTMIEANPGNPLLLQRRRVLWESNFGKPK